MKRSDANILVVFAWLAGRYVPAGKLRMSGRQAEFWYGDHFRQHGYALDPLRLPLTREVFTAEGLQGDLGVLGDALPDSWGRHLIKRQCNQSLSDLQILSLDASRQRMGGLFFSSKLDDSLEDKAHHLEWMQQFSQWIIDNKNDFPERMELGSSAGGAKPKCLVQIDEIEWIAKFQPGNEPLNKPAIEHATLRLANACGIPVPDSRLIDLDNTRQALLVKRFDRDKMIPLHYMSGQTLCGVLFNDAEQVINDTRSYLILADLLSKVSADPQIDRVDLFRRIVFNILVNNHDDHAKNHGVVRSLDGQWRLSKAFDLVAGEGGSCDLAMSIGPEGSKATFHNLLQSVDSFGLSRRDAIGEITIMVENIQNWKQLFEDSGVSKNTINEITWAIQDSINVSGL